MGLEQVKPAGRCPLEDWPEDEPEAPSYNTWHVDALSRYLLDHHCLFWRACLLDGPFCPVPWESKALPSEVTQEAGWLS